VHGFLLEANRVRWYGRVVAFFEEHLSPRGSSTTGR
jgi:dipeptidyl aminopeptidase/acylaminoacyl peptidase